VLFVLVLSTRCNLGCDDYLEDKSEDYWNCSVKYCVPQPQLHTVISIYECAVLSGVLRACWFRLFRVSVFFLPRPSLFILCFWCIFYCLFSTSRGTWGNFGETRGGVGKSDMLEHKSAISLKRVKIEEKLDSL